MKIAIISAILAILSFLSTRAQDTLWVRYDNRFTENKAFQLNSKIDSVEFCLSSSNYKQEPVLKMYNATLSKGYLEYRLSSLLGSNQTGDIMFENPGRILCKPSTYGSVDFTNENSQWCFKRSMESEHFVVFWEKEFGNDPTKACIACRRRLRCWWFFA